MDMAFEPVGYIAVVDVVIAHIVVADILVVYVVAQ